MDVNAPTMTRIAEINKNRLFFPNICSIESLLSNSFNYQSNIEIVKMSIYS